MEDKIHFLYSLLQWLGYALWIRLEMTLYKTMNASYATPQSFWGRKPFLLTKSNLCLPWKHHQCFHTSNRGFIAQDLWLWVTLLFPSFSLMSTFNSLCYTMPLIYRPGQVVWVGVCVTSDSKYLFLSACYFLSDRKCVCVCGGRSVTFGSERATDLLSVATWCCVSRLLCWREKWAVNWRFAAFNSQDSLPFLHLIFHPPLKPPCIHPSFDWIGNPPLALCEQLWQQLWGEMESLGVHPIPSQLRERQSQYFQTSLQVLSVYWQSAQSAFIQRRVCVCICGKVTPHWG